MTSIEQLKKETDKIKNSLDELKNNVSLPEEEKKKKAEDLKSQAETTKQKIQSEIDALSDKTDDESKKKKEEAETLLSSFNETMSLYASILSSTESTPAEATNSETQEEKWFFTKTKEWVWEQWDDVWDKEKWKDEWWKNLLRTAWFAATWVWAGALIIKWIRKIFWRNYEKEIPWYKDMSREKKREARKEYRKKKRKEKREWKEEKENKWEKEWLSWWKKFLIWAWITTWTVVWWVSIYKNWNKISSWFKEKLWKALNFDEAMYSVEAEVRNWINSDNNFWEFSAHFNGMSYDENTHEISSFWQTTKIDKSNKTIEWEDMSAVQFASWEELFHAVNIINFAKRELKWRGAKETPFTVNQTTWDIDFDLSEAWKTQFIGANWSNFWTTVLGLWWAWWCWLLWWYFLWLKWWLVGVAAWWLAWYTLWSVIDNTSTMWRACSTIAKWANLKRFVSYLNKQNIWWEQEEVYEPENTTPIHKYLNKVKQEIDETYWNWSEDSAKRDLQVEWDENRPDTYKIKSYYQEITLKLEWCTAKKWEEIDLSKIKKIHIESYDTISEKRIESWWDWLDINFPNTWEWIEEAIRTANFTNKITNDRKWKWWESYPFFRWRYSTPPSLDMDVDWFRWKTILSRDAAKKFPTLFEDLRKWSGWWFWTALWFNESHQKEMHEQAIHDKSEGSQYIKFLHQIGKWKFRKKVW